ncbi:MAG: hypothetical protein KDD22_04065, partial [Bdellovibrionales bacterium]|nr:hypothetical protein [Bdellovibrionales bacterium]
SKIKMIYLRERAKLPSTPALEFPIQNYERPDESHGSARAGLSYGHQSERGEWIEADMRFALHDLLDPQYGYPKNAQIEFFRFTGSYYKDEDKVQLDEMKFFEVKLVSPLERLERSYSWRAQIGFDRSSVDCTDCLAAQLLLQGGGALGFFQDRLITYLLVGGNTLFSPRFEKNNLRVSPLGTLGVRVRFTENLNFLTHAEYQAHKIYGLSDESSLQAEVRQAFGKNWALGANYKMDQIYAVKDLKNETYRFRLFYYF